jgi:molybdate transport system regulatory protein
MVKSGFTTTRIRQMRLSARNQLPGTVASVDVGAVMAAVVIRLEGGQEVVAAITKESVDSLGLNVGDAVTAVIKATEVMVGKE